ncbi:MAG: NAD(P)-binding protein [Deltaproteobacteria bacterium]|nr:NAD(P)-binding protein [Deltaproteobacteria bacterium]
MPSRRDILAALLGLPAVAALPGCERRTRMPGEIVGADAVVGHLLREGGPTGQVDGQERVPTVIIGSGIAGLTAAWRLASSSYDRFVILELEAESGGTSRSGSSPISPYPWGAHYVPVPSSTNRTLVRCLQEMGVITGFDSQGEPEVGEQFLIPEPEERVFYRGEWYEGLMPDPALDADDTEQMRRFRQELARWSQWRDDRGRRAFSLPIAHGSEDPEVMALDSMSMSEWMDRRGLRATHLRWYVDYACRDDYGCRLDTTSAWAGLFYFVSRVRTKGGSSAPLLTWPEGNGGIVRHLLSRIGDRIRTSQLAFDLIPREDWVEVLVMDARSRRVQSILADRVILAVPRFVAGKLLRPWRDRPPDDVTAFETAPWLVANLFLKDRPRSKGCVPAWDNVFYDSPSLGYVCATHQRGRRYGPTVLTWYHALTDADPKRARQRLLSASREEWIEAILTDMERAHPEISSLVERIDVCRWGHAMVRARPGFVWSKVRRRAARVLFDRIHPACTDLSGVALLEEAQYHGVRAAEEVLAAAGAAVDSWL